MTLIVFRLILILIPWKLMLMNTTGMTHLKVRGLSWLAEKLLASVGINVYSIVPPMRLLIMGIQNANARI